MITYVDNILSDNEFTLHKKLIHKYIDSFSKMGDVINGSAFNMGHNRPIGWHQAISTTGYCVKVSSVFLERMLKNDELFMDAKVQSITLDTNKFGKCGDGSPNSWHTAIDTQHGYIIDLTIAQFGSKYEGKYIWLKCDWLNEFQSNDDNRDVGAISIDGAKKLTNKYNKI